MDLRLVYGGRARDVGDELCAEACGKGFQKLLFACDIAPVANDAAELYDASRSEAAHALGDVVRRVERHELPRGNDVDFLGIALSYRHGETAADDIAEHIVDGDIDSIKRMERLEPFERHDDAAPRAADARLRAARLDAAHAAVSLVRDFRKRKRRALLAALRIEHGERRDAP